jgi:hypothetical protein
VFEFLLGGSALPAVIHSLGGDAVDSPDPDSTTCGIVSQQSTGGFHNREEKAMKYMMMMNVPAGTGDYQINSWAPEDFQAHIAFMMRFHGELVASGE